MNIHSTQATTTNFRDQHEYHIRLVTDVAKLNNAAVECMKMGMNSPTDASTYLYQALRVSASLPNATCANLQDFNNNNLEPIIQSLEKGSPSSPSSPSSPRNCNTEDYDEGMRVFPDPIHVPSLSKMSLQSMVAGGFDLHEL